LGLSGAHLSSVSGLLLLSLFLDRSGRCLIRLSLLRLSCLCRLGLRHLSSRGFRFGLGLLNSVRLGRSIGLSRGRFRSWRLSLVVVLWLLSLLGWCILSGRLFGGRLSDSFGLDLFGGLSGLLDSGWLGKLFSGGLCLGRWRGFGRRLGLSGLFGRSSSSGLGFGLVLAGRSLGLRGFLARCILRRLPVKC
jgi:hypothetical protein